MITAFDLGEEKISAVPMPDGFDELKGNVFIFLFFIFDVGSN